MISELYKNFDVHRIPKAYFVNNNKYAEIVIGNQRVLHRLCEFINLHNIPHMERKWNIIERSDAN